MTIEGIGDFNSCQKLKRTYTNEQFNELNSDLIHIRERVQIIVVLDGKNELIKNLISSMFERYRKRCENVTFALYVNDEVCSVGTSRNFIINNAKGEYVKFCDDDDLSININELLNVLDESDGADYIECCMSNLTKPVDKPTFSGWYPTNVIVKTNFLRSNRLMFVPHIVGEDSIWRCDIYETIKRTPTVNVKVINKPIYLIYWKSSKTVSENDETNFTRMMINIFEHEKDLFGKIPLNTSMFYVIGNMSYNNKHFLDMSSYIINNADDFEFSEFIKAINAVRINIVDAKFQPSTSVTECPEVSKAYWNEQTKADIRFKRLIANTGSREFIKLADAFTKTFSNGYFQKLFTHMNRKTTLMINVNYKYHNVIETLNVGDEFNSKTFNELNSFTLDNLVNANPCVPFVVFSWIYLNPLTAQELTSKNKVTAFIRDQHTISHVNNPKHVKSTHMRNKIMYMACVVMFALTLLEWFRLHL